MNDFWKSLSIVLNILGIITLIFFSILVLNLRNYIDSPYWSLGAGLTWLMFLTTISIFIIAANLRWLPTPKKFENKSIKEALEENK